MYACRRRAASRARSRPITPTRTPPTNPPYQARRRASSSHWAAVISGSWRSSGGRKSPYQRAAVLITFTAGSRSPAKRGHDLSREASELLDHEIARCPDRPRDHDVVQPGIAALHLLEVGDDVRGRPAEPGAIAHAVLQGGGGRRLRLPGRDRPHVLLAVAQHPQRGHDLGVLLEVWTRPPDGPLHAIVDAHPEAEDQVLAELERAAVAARRLLVVADPALGQLFRGGGDDALDAVPGHEVETARAAAHDGLPDLHRPAPGTRHQGDLLQLVAAIGDLGGNRVVLPPVRERVLAERLEDDLYLLLEELAVGLSVQHRVAEGLHLARMVPAPHPEDDPAAGEDVGDRVVLGEAEWMPGGDDVEGAADLHPLGAMGQVHRQHGDAGDAFVSLVLEVMLG